MSTDNKTTTTSVDLCASCGIAKDDDIKLKICDGSCDLVKFCSDDCQELHGEHYDCKAELHDKELFEQSDSSYKGECPICCFQQAAIGGHPGARGLLACYEMDNRRFERAAKHLIISANLGCDYSLQQIKELFVMGMVSKEYYAAALRGHQAAVDATKNAERGEAEAFVVMDRRIAKPPSHLFPSCLWDFQQLIPFS